MAFARKVWKLLVAIKDGLVLLFMLLFFGLLYAALSFRPLDGAHVQEGALLVALDGVVVEEPEAIDPFSMLLSTGTPIREHRARDVIRAIEGAATDDRIKAVVLDLDYFLGGGQVHMTEIGKAIDKVRAAKKPVLAHAYAYTGDGMQLAAHASEVWVDPLGGALVAGPGGTFLFYGDIADRLKVNVHVYRTGEYKSAVEPYTLSRFSDAARRDIEGTYGALWENWVDEVAKARPKAKAREVALDPVSSIQAAGGDGARAALAAGMVDKIGSYEDFPRALANWSARIPKCPKTRIASRIHSIPIGLRRSHRPKAAKPSASSPSRAKSWMARPAPALQAATGSLHCLTMRWRMISPRWWCASIRRAVR